MNTASTPPNGQPTEITFADFIPLPIRSMVHNGVTFTRSTLIRAIESKEISSRLFRQPGRMAGRRYIMTASLDAYLQRCMVEEKSPLHGEAAKRKKAAEARAAA